MSSPTLTKRYSPEILRRRTPLTVAVVGLLLVSAVLQRAIDPTAKLYHVGEGNITRASSGLNNEFLILPLLGFREAAAGLLWVRCDEFFHSGDYDAILPLVRLITWLDPHAENVFVTGAWHLAYNFTDSSERSDRRYIAPSQALLDEGIINNMNIPDIKFEKGWENYDKIKDFIAAERAFKLAIAGPRGDESGMKGSDDYPYASPLKTHHTLAHTYEKQGRIPEALAEWKRAIARSDKMLAANKDDQATKQMRAAEMHNYQITLQRYYDRYTTKNHSAVNASTYPAVLRPAPNNPKPQPWDVSLVPQIEVVRPKVLKVSGQFNTADGSRVDLKVTDFDYTERPIGATLNNFDIDLSQTVLMDALAVRKNHFEREIDMSKDPKMYGFNQPYYRITLSYNPRTTSPHLHDRFGWSGEGMTDANPAHVVVDRRDVLRGTKLIEGQEGDGPLWDGVTIPWPQHGQPIRMIKVTYKVSRDQIMGLKPITDKDIIPNQ